MSGDWCLEEPVPYVLTDFGLWETDDLPPAPVHCCRDCGRTYSRIGDLVQHRFLSGGCPERVAAERESRERARQGAPLARQRPHAPRRTPQSKGGGRPVRLPAGPLLAAVDARGGASACGLWRDDALARAYCRAKHDGHLTERAADALAVRLLGMTLWEVYGEIVAA